MLIILFRVYNTAIACYNVLALEGQHPRTAADDEPTSRADKARGVSPNKYIIRLYTILTRLAAFGKQKYSSGLLSAQG